MTKKPKVFIAPGDSYHAAISMFERAGFEVTKDFETVDLVCFLGGTDVDPAIYGEERGPYTQSPDTARDKTEVGLYERFKGVPKVGICRGGQLLNVLNGGKMIQHLGKCISGDVDVVIHRGDNLDLGYYCVKMRVDHHQGIVLSGDAECDAWPEDISKELWDVDYAGFYEKTKSLCFQPHPEWGHKGTEDYFFELIERYFGFARKDTKCAA